MHETIVQIHAAANQLTSEHERCNLEGQLTDQAAKILRTSGGMRLLQASNHGGYEADPRVFFEWVRAIARYNPAAGWVAGVVGVHPWEFALHDPQLQREIYGEDQDTWVASPYAPMGRATRGDDGFRFSGRWQYSTGTDQCDWIVLGGLVVDESATPTRPPDFRHFVLPRGDYEVVEDSWHVMGLEGTGSKDIRVEDAWVPAYRTISHEALCAGDYGHRRTGTARYQLPFGCVFSGAIAAATLGIAEGAIARYRSYLETRVSAAGVVGTADPFQQQALAEAEADLAAGIVHIDATFAGWMDRAERGERITLADRLEFKRNQVRAVQRVLFSVDCMMSRAGSAAVWTTRPLQRAWRDLRTAGTHICNIMDTAYIDWANHAFQVDQVPRTLH